MHCLIDFLRIIWLNYPCFSKFFWLLRNLCNVLKWKMNSKSTLSALRWLFLALKRYSYLTKNGQLLIWLYEKYFSRDPIWDIVAARIRMTTVITDTGSLSTHRVGRTLGGQVLDLLTRGEVKLKSQWWWGSRCLLQSAHGRSLGQMWSGKYYLSFWLHNSFKNCFHF
jgi:hypothetical protein